MPTFLIVQTVEAAKARSAIPKIKELTSEVSGMTQEELLELIAGIARRTEENQRQTEANQRQIDELRQAQAETNRELRSLTGDTMQMIGTLATEMHTMQRQILGLQTENQRILETLRDRGEGSAND